MKQKLERLWNEDDGFVLSTEMVLYGTVGVVGVTAGYAALRDSVNSELNDVAKAIGCLDQSYWFSPVVGHSAWSAGSAYYDRADFCDQTPPVPTAVEVPLHPDRPLVCADVFGRPDPAHPHRPHHVPHPGPDSLPGRGAAALPPADVVVGQPTAARAVLPPPSKGVYIGEPNPVYVVGSPALVPAPRGPFGFPPVNVMVNPWQAGPHLVDVPEGYFNQPPGILAPPPHFRVFVDGHGGPHDYGYAYAPAHPPVHHDKPVRWDTIDLGFAKVGDDDLKHIEKFADAKCLHVLGSNVTDKGLGYIAQLTGLESLHLVGTQITDDGLKQLTGLKKLRFLHLVGTKITDRGLAWPAGMTQLQELDLRGTPVSDAALDELRRTRPDLRVIR
jgi:hypothetical protein